MERLTVIGVEDDTLVVEAPSGARYGIAVADIPRPRRRPDTEPVQRKTTPREIQTLIRQGMTAQEVHERTGDDLEYIRRFESPVLAERAHILLLAQRTPVASGDIDPLAGERSFEEAMRERLAEIDAHDVEWLAWREVDRGWVIRLTFTSDGTRTDARWAFDHRKQSLVPVGKEAKALSQSGDATSVLVPRLRPVDTNAADDAGAEPAEADEDRSVHAARAAATSTEGQPLGTRRFDSDAFRFAKGDVTVEEPAAEPAPQRERPASRSTAAATEPSHTADLLDALRRRRTERDQAASAADEPAAAQADADDEDTPLFQVEETVDTGEPEPEGRQHTSPLQATKRKGSRASMPSWDEIVFGSRSDD